MPKSVRYKHTINSYTEVYARPDKLYFPFLQCAILFLTIMGAVSCSKMPLTTPTALLYKSLRNGENIGTYVGYNATKQVLYLGNQLIERRFHLNKGGRAIQTIYYTHKPSGRNYITVPSLEFKFRIGEIQFVGDSDLLKYTSYEVEQIAESGKHLIVELRYADESEKPILGVKIHYEIYRQLPIIRKWITFENLTDSGFFLEDIVIESLPSFSKRRHQPSKARSKSTEDSEVLHFIHDSSGERGMILANEAAGITRHDNTHATGLTMELGLIPTASINGIEIRVPPRTLVSSPGIWTMLFSKAQSTPPKTVDPPVPATLWSLSTMKGATSTIIWTKAPSYDNIAVGNFTIEDYNFLVVDYDWNKEALLELNQLSQQIHNNGSKFGIRLPVAELNLEVLDYTPWSLRPTTNFGQITASDTTTDANLVQKRIYCVLSDYGYYLSHAVRELCEEVEVDILILDRPIIGMDGDALKGCGTQGHAHFNRRESIELIYRWLFQFSDYLHQQHPNLKLGITSTAYGTETADLAVLHHFDFFFRQ